MTDKAQLGLRTLGVALALGLLADQLVRPNFPGLSNFLWILALLAGLLALARWHHFPLVGEGRWLLLPALLAAFGMVWRDSAMLVGLDILTLAATLSLIVLTARKGSLRNAGITDYVAGFFKAGFETLTSPFSLLLSDVDWKELPRSRWTERVVPIVRGLLIAVPLLIVFGGLFMAADALFERSITGLFRFALDDVLEHFMVVVFWSWLVAGFLRTTLLDRESVGLPDMKKPGRFGLGETEIVIVLGLLNLLFLAFVSFQFRYFFGGAAVLNEAGLTYADYARRGFFELVTASALVLPVLLGGHWLISDDHPRAERFFRVLASTLVAMLLVIMASAMQRMFLYQDAFGLTELRLYATVFMIWLAVLFGWFVLTVLAGRRERFAFGALVSGLAVLFALHALNPDLYIARTNIARANIARAEQGKEFDGRYLNSLSAAAVPELVKALPYIDPQIRSNIAQRLWWLWSNPNANDWRSWNWDRYQARRVLEANQEIFAEAKRIKEQNVQSPPVRP